MLGVPPNASPEKYVQNYRPPAIIGTKRKAGALRLSGSDGVSVKPTKPDLEGKEPSRKKRKSDNGLAAVMMDDDIEEGEVGEDHGIFDDTDDEDDEDEDEDEDEEEGEVSEAIGDDSGVTGIDSAEEGEVFSLPLDIKALSRRARDESVSHDSDDYEIQPPQPRTEPEVAESRYSVGKKGKATPKRKGKKASMAVVRSDSDSDSSSGSSIVALSGPPPTDPGKEGSKAQESAGNGEKSGGPRLSGVGNKERRDFWSAKAGKKDEGEAEDNEDAFGDGADFVRL